MTYYLIAAYFFAAFCMFCALRGHPFFYQTTAEQILGGLAWPFIVLTRVFAALLFP